MSGDMRDMAENLRRLAKQCDPAFSTRAIVASCFPGAIVTGRQLPDGVHELVTVTDYGPLIVYKRGLALGEQRFAIAHAVGHLVLDVTPEGRLPGSIRDEVIENRADEFACELLVPLRTLEPYADHLPHHRDELGKEMYLDRVDEIASIFKVQPWLIEKQIQRLSPRHFPLARFA